MQKDSPRGKSQNKLKILQEIDDWQHRPIDETYPIIFINAVHFSVREDNVIKKRAAYVMLAITLSGRKEVINLQIGENESSKYWLGTLNDLKNQGVKDIMVIYADGLSGMKEAIATAFPNTEISALYCSSSKKYPKICILQRYEEICCRFEDHLPSAKRTARIRQYAKSCRKMGADISSCHEKLGTELGCAISNFQVFR